MSHLVHHSICPSPQLSDLLQIICLHHKVLLRTQTRVLKVLYKLYFQWMLKLMHTEDKKKTKKKEGQTGRQIVTLTDWSLYSKQTVWKKKMAQMSISWLFPMRYGEWKHAIPGDNIFLSPFRLSITSNHNKRLKPGGNILGFSEILHKSSYVPIRLYQKTDVTLRL